MNARKLLQLSAIFLASWGLYLVLALRYPLGTSLADPRASWVNITGPSWANTGLHLAVYLGLTVLYFTALRWLAQTQADGADQRHFLTAIIVIAWLACSGVLLAVAPGGESHDIFDYLFRGRMIVEYHGNPLIDVPNDYPRSTPYTHYLAWRKNVDTYGPIWEAASAGIARSVHQVSGWLGWWVDSFPVCPESPKSCRLLIVYITGYRLLAIVFTGLGGWLVASIVARSQASLAPMALAAWLLSPMTLVASALGGHNDAIMLALILSCWWLLQRQRPYLALLALILAAHIKLTALIWLPACALWIIRKWGWRDALKIGLVGLASGMAVSWLLYAPFGGWQTLPRMLHERSLYLTNSPWRILKTLLIDYLYWPVSRAQQLSISLSGWLFGAGMLLIPLWAFNFRPKRWRTAPVQPAIEVRKLWRVLVWVSILYLTVGSFWFQSWYVLWALAPAVLLPDSRFTRSNLPWLAFGALSANFAMDYYYATFLESTPRILGHSLAVTIIWGPVLIAMGVQFWSGRVHRPRPAG